ncbi:uncharacterized protein LOC144180672 isoform X2 [Haemaphysalis longicornis]
MRFTSPGEFPFKQRRGGPWSVLPSLSFPKGLVPLDGSQPVASESDGSVLPPLRQYIRLQKWDQEGNDVFLSKVVLSAVKGIRDAAFLQRATDELPWDSGLRIRNPVAKHHWRSPLQPSGSCHFQVS